MRTVGDAERCLRRLCEFGKEEFGIMPDTLVVSDRVPPGCALRFNARPTEVYANFRDVMQWANGTVTQFGGLRLRWQLSK